MSVAGEAFETCVLRGKCSSRHTQGLLYDASFALPVEESERQASGEEAAVSAGSGWRWFVGAHHAGRQECRTPTPEGDYRAPSPINARSRPSRTAGRITRSGIGPVRYSSDKTGLERTRADTAIIREAFCRDAFSGSRQYSGRRQHEDYALIRSLSRRITSWAESSPGQESDGNLWTSWAKAAYGLYTARTRAPRLRTWW